jgi:hypothetical protein
MSHIIPISIKAYHTTRRKISGIAESISRSRTQISKNSRAELRQAGLLKEKSEVT